MPQVVAALAPIALKLAVGIGASLLAGLISAKKDLRTQAFTTSRGLTFEMEVGEATAVSAVLGMGRAAGQLVYINEFGADNEFVQFVIKIGHGWHDGLEHFLVDEKPAALAGSNDDPHGRSVVPFTAEGTPYLWVKTYSGAPGQTADPELVARSNPTGRWSAAHKMTGCAYMVITCRYHADLYGNTIPRFGSVWRGLRLHDWRVPGAVWGDQSTYVFTKNPAVIRWNFRRGIWVNGVRVLGQGFSAHANDLAGYTAAANRCDEPFFEPVSGKTFPVFEFGRQVSDNEEKLSVLQDLADAYCGSSFKRGGADVPLVAQQLVSVMTLRDSDRLSGMPVRTDRKGAVSKKKTMFHGQFVSADLAWGMAPFVPRIDAALESLIGGRRAIALDQPYEHLQERAQLRADIALRRQFYSGMRVETFTPRAMVLEPGDPVIRECDWGTVLMVVEKVSRLSDMTGVTVTLSEWNNSIVPASGESFIALPSGPGAGPSNPDRTIAVSTFGVLPFDREGGGAVHPFGKATWKPITDPNVDQVLIRIWPSAGSEADDGQDFFADSKLTSTKLLGPLQPMTEYSAKAIPIRGDARSCVWTNVASFTTGAESVPLEPGSVGPEHMIRDLRALPMLVDQLGEGMSGLEARLGALAMVVADNTLLTQQMVSGISVRNAGAMAAVVRVEKVTVEQKAALATLSEDVAVNIGNLSAGGTLRMESHVDELTGVSTVMFKVKATNGEFTAQSALQIGASVTVDGADSWIALMGDRLYMLATSGDYAGTPFAVRSDANGYFVSIDTLRVRYATSEDGTSWRLSGGATPSLIFEKP